MFNATSASRKSMRFDSGPGVVRQESFYHWRSLLASGHDCIGNANQRKGAEARRRRRKNHNPFTTP